MQGDIALSFKESPSDYPHLTETTVFCDIGNKGILELKGEGSRKFLQGQTSADFNLLEEKTPLRGTFCSSQGRVLSNFTALQTSDDHIFLLMTKELIPATIKDKIPYAAFFDTQMKDISLDYQVVGLNGPNCKALLSSIYGCLPSVGESLNLNSGEIIISLPLFTPNALQVKAPAEDTRFILIIPESFTAERWQQLEQQARAIGQPYWQLLDIRAGLADIYPATSNVFIPQMLNYHLNDAVSFNKGCYTGQEVVARMQYRGTLKRRLYHLNLSMIQPPLPGTEIINQETDSPIGRIVISAPANTGQCEALAVLNEKEIESTGVFSWTLNGESLSVELLPLALPTTDKSNALS